MNEENNCRLDLPYPEVRVQGRNTSDAALLSNDYAGQISEMSAVSQYSYQHLITQDARISKAVACISMVEMHHFEMVGKLIFMLGGNPRIAVQNNCAVRFWTAQNIDYCADPKCYLIINIESEEKAIASYLKRIEQINDAYVHKVLERIILDEEHHIKIFHQLLNEICT